MTPSDTSAAPRPLPFWASIPIILVCLSAGGWIIHWYVGTRVRADEPHLLGDLPELRMPAAPTVGGGNGRRGFGGLFGGGRNRPGVTSRPDSGGVLYEARSADADVTCGFVRDRPPRLRTIRYVLGGPGYPLAALTDDVKRTLDNARRIGNDPDLAKQLKVSDDARRKLVQLSQLVTPANPLEMDPSAADRALLVADFAACQSADAAQAKLLADLQAVAARSGDASRAKAVDRANRVNALVTPAQWAQFNASGR